jgi:hypothetical protein
MTGTMKLMDLGAYSPSVFKGKINADSMGSADGVVWV